jgi:hypothetical protein
LNEAIVDFLVELRVVEVRVPVSSEYFGSTRAMRRPRRTAVSFDLVKMRTPRGDGADASSSLSFSLLSESSVDDSSEDDSEDDSEDESEDESEDDSEEDSEDESDEEFED